jgi:hypothetical protein
VILKGLAKNPADRYQNALEFKQELERVGEALYRAVGWIETTSFDLSTLSGMSPAPTLPLEPERGPPVDHQSVTPTSVPIESEAPPEPPPTVPVTNTRLLVAVFIAAVVVATLVAAGLVLLIWRLS